MCIRDRSKVLEVASIEFGVALPLGNPVAKVRMPSTGPARDRRLTAEEFEKLLGACSISRNPWLHSAVLLSVETAMRQGELLALSWDDVKKSKSLALLSMRIPVNVTADSGNVTGIPAKVTEGRCCAF